MAQMSKAPERLSQQQLEAYLWGAANLLRGLVDAGDYKQYIFPLLFFKRLSDVWDEEYQNALDESNDKRYAQSSADDRFAIPDSAHWSDVRSSSRDVGRAVLNAFRAIEAANLERLSGIFGNASWTDKAQMPDKTLKNLIEHFSQHSLSLASVPEDELGNAYEYLIKKFADDSGHTAQEFREAFQVGEDERYISSVDADGISMAAIQSLYDMVKERNRAMEAQEKRIHELEEEIAAQKRFMAELEAHVRGIRTGPRATRHF
jgi:type I restriction-modification system DNA methylase subunit